MKHFLSLIVTMGFLACQPASSPTPSEIASPKPISVADTTRPSARSIIQQGGATLQHRILPPEGYERVEKDSLSFAAYLRQLPLHPHGSPVRLYNGSLKSYQQAHVAVVDLPIGTRDLHQCADAIMRLRAEYLWQQGQYDRIHFNFTNGFRVDYIPWMQGKRIRIEGNRSYWVNSTSPSNTYEDFWRYLEIVFAYAGTLSLEKELLSVPKDELQIGDVFIQGGSPGHAVLVVDKAVHPVSGKVLFLLAQSYMPAQEIHILRNPSDADLSPWYSLEFETTLSTPEWQFQAEDLKRFEGV